MYGPDRTLRKQNHIMMQKEMSQEVSKQDKKRRHSVISELVATMYAYIFKTIAGP